MDEYEVDAESLQGADEKLDAALDNAFGEVQEGNVYGVVQIADKQFDGYLDSLGNELDADGAYVGETEDL
jgi:hypothetical protein